MSSARQVFTIHVPRTSSQDGADGEETVERDKLLALLDSQLRVLRTGTVTDLEVLERELAEQDRLEYLVLYTVDLRPVLAETLESGLPAGSTVTEMGRYQKVEKSWSPPAT